MTPNLKYQEILFFNFFKNFQHGFQQNFTVFFFIVSFNECVTSCVKWQIQWQTFSASPERANRGNLNPITARFVPLPLCLSPFRHLWFPI